jgi:glycosyltransferase involved in cell wall biosynthesis
MANLTVTADTQDKLRLPLRNTRPFRLAIVLSHPVQYFSPLFRTLATQPGLELTVYYGSRRGAVPMVDPGFGKAYTWDVPLLEGYRYKFLARLFRDAGGVPPTRQLNPSIVSEITPRSCDAVWVHGYMGNTARLAILTALAKGLPVLMRGESHLRTEPLFAAKRYFKSLALGGLFRRLAGFLCIGTLNKAYYQHFGVPESRLFWCPYTVDNAFFRRQADALAPQRCKVRARWGIHDFRPVVLFAGRLGAVKQPLLLLEAYRRVRQRRACALLMAGDGPLRGEIEAEIRRSSIPDVRITGFLNQTEMPKAYAAADLLALPSRAEPWGLVVNEAMNFSLPIVVSDRVGCGPDLVRPGLNGEVFEHSSVDALQTVLERCIARPERLVEFGRASLERIQQWGLSETASGVMTALAAVSSKAA